MSRRLLGPKRRAAKDAHGHQRFGRDRPEDGSLDARLNAIASESTPQPLLAHWPNTSASLLAGYASGRLKRKYIPIDISAYQQNGCPSPVSPLSPGTNSEELQDPASAPASGQVEVAALDQPKSGNNEPFPIGSEIEITGIHARSQIQRYLPGITAVYACPASQSRCQNPGEPKTPQSTNPSPRLRHENRAVPSPLKPRPLKIVKSPLSFQSLKTGNQLDSLHASLSIPGMNHSQTSLSGPEGSRDDVPNGSRTAASAAAQAENPNGPNPQPPAPGPTNLSGLVCNVHRTTGDEPRPLVGATTTILGDKLYVFGGRVLSRTHPHLTSDLYELDLIKRHWTKLEMTGDIPPPRYFHSVCGLGDRKLVCYGGMTPSPNQTNQSTNVPQGESAQPEVVVASDIHIFDVVTRAWSLITTADTPQGRYAHCATILPSSAVFTSANAPMSAIVHNPPSSNPHSGTLGVRLDGTGGAEMVVVGGQDSSNHYIEQISVFNLRSLKWTATSTLGRSCGAYRSVVAPLHGIPVPEIGSAMPGEDGAQNFSDPDEQGTAMLIYSNYNFLDVKLELQIRMPDGSLSERTMTGPVSPPGLRFPNGGITNNHFVVSGTYLTSSKQEYALWALDLRTLSWGRIDAGANVFSQGSWNRGVLWNRRNNFVVLGHRKRSLVDDYNHRRLNFSHFCVVELEAFGLYENPRKSSPTSDYISSSAPYIPPSFQASVEDRCGGGRPFSDAAAEFGQLLLETQEFADMDLVGIDGEKLPVNSRILSRRWGPFFNQLLLQASSSQDNWSMSDVITLRPQMNSQASRNSSITITPSMGKSSAGSASSNASTLNNSISTGTTASATRAALTALEASNESLPAASRPRTLYLPHTSHTLRLLVHFLYTSSLPPPNTQLCTAHTLCSLLQLARPYQISGLLEATVERLHEVLDGRNAAAVFNASAMAAGGGRAAGMTGDARQLYLERLDGEANELAEGRAKSLTKNAGDLKINTAAANRNARQPAPQQKKTDSPSNPSTPTSTSTTTSLSQTEDNEGTDGAPAGKRRDEKAIWAGDLSSVIGLQKRGLRGLMEGRRLRERGITASAPSSAQDAVRAGVPTAGVSAI